MALLPRFIPAVTLLFLLNSFSNADETQKSLARNCRDCALAGLEENGFCTLFDKDNNKFTAYCDITSEPGYAWTLITSFSRHIVRTEPSQVLKRKSLGDDGPVNQNSPNWVAFRYGKQRIESLIESSTHLRYTCSEDGPFMELKNYNDYLRVKLSGFNPLTLNVHHEKCVPAEFFNVRNVSCVNCMVSFSQRRDVWSLHVDSWLAQHRCGLPRINDQAVHSEDMFGFYDQYNVKFTCTKYDWSTTQLWFGSILLPEN